MARLFSGGSLKDFRSLAIKKFPVLFPGTGKANGQPGDVVASPAAERDTRLRVPSW
jgi:hypothetical protein